MTDEALAIVDPEFGHQPLDLGGFRITEDGLEVIGEPTDADWIALGARLRLLHVSMPFIVGDWMNYGEARFEKLAAQYVSAEHWSDETQRVYQWVAKKVPRENRRMRELSFYHHQLVAALPVVEQKKWLAHAAGENEAGVKQTAAEMRQSMRTASVLEAAPEWGLYIAFDSMADRDIVAREHERAGRVVKRIDRTKKVDPL